MENIHLHGAEDVKRAAREIGEAGCTMRGAANTIDEALRRHAQFLDDWLSRFEAAKAPTVVVPADPNVERAQLIELCGRVSAYEAAYAAIDGAINDPALDTARTYEIIRNALASVTK